MAFRRSTRTPARRPRSNRRFTRSPARRRAPARRSNTRRTTPQTIRIVIEQPAPAPFLPGSTLPGQVGQIVPTKPRGARF